MSMRGAPRRRSDAVQASLTGFSWPRTVVATLRHCSLPWSDCAASQFALPGVPLLDASDLGARDRLSLVAQFAAHAAFLQFAGVSDVPFDPAEWIVIRKRGRDCRLVRVAAAASVADSLAAVFSSIHDFAEAIGAPRLETLRQSWARAETVYAEIATKLSADIEADLTCMREAAVGEVVSPGAEALRMLSPGVHRYTDERVRDALTVLSAIDSTTHVVSIGTDFPFQRYSALAEVDAALVNTARSETDVAEIVADTVARQRTVIIVRPHEALDAASRRVIDIASRLGGATWLLHGKEGELPPSRFFVLSPRLIARHGLDEAIATARDAREWLRAFVLSSAYDRYLERGAAPSAPAGFEAVVEPKRSFIAALALLGVRTPHDVAANFMREFAFEQPLEQLCVAGISAIDGDCFAFASEPIREHCASHIPAASRPALFRAAAAVCEPRRAALLLFEAGETETAIAALESIEWTCDTAIATLSALPKKSLSPRLAEVLGEALIDCGRYRDATALSSLMAPAVAERVLARAERRTGDYATALRRLQRLDGRDFAANLLAAELLRLAGRYAEAASLVATVEPSNDSERLRLAYEAALVEFEQGHAVDDGWMQPDEYFSLRFATYRALRDNDFVSAAALSSRAVTSARSTIERIDAWLDRVFTSFSSGNWEDTRALSLEALTTIDEAQNDRAAAAIVYTLAYLAADDAHWSTAAHLIKRLRTHHGELGDSERLIEIDLLEAHLQFCRGNFSSARTHAETAYGRVTLIAQIREAAALILDEIDWIEGSLSALRSSGRSGNAELTRRHDIIRSRVDIQNATSRSERLQLFRAAWRAGRIEVVRALTQELDLTPPTPALPTGPEELSVLTLAATAEYPFRAELFGGRRWSFASRNRLGHWSAIGPDPRSTAELEGIRDAASGDWVAIGDRELLYFDGIDRWSETSRRALASVFSLRSETMRLRRLTSEANEPRKVDAIYDIAGESPAIRAVFHLIDRVSARDVAVCIVGESGTGKELVARAIQRASPRRAKPFTTINCAALPETLIESELFGHARGAFTGADRDRAGLIETADGGTLFLDEAGELPLVAQAKLLRFLQDGEFRRVGETATRTADVRIISATNRKLEAAVEDGSFREDLYYRLRGVEIALPPLRDRGDDVLLLANHFLAAERSQHRAGPVAFSPEVETLLRLYRWPGNVRELQNTIRVAHAMAGDGREIDLDHLPERMRQAMPERTAAGSYQDAVARFRRDLIEKSLLEAAGNQNRAAAMLNISRQALAYQIRELGIMVGKRPRA